MVKDVLNIGVSPKLLIAKIKEKFVNLGGKVLENTAFESAIVSQTGVTVKFDRQQL